MAEPAETKTEAPAAESSAEPVITRGERGRFQAVGAKKARSLGSLSDRMAAYDAKHGGSDDDGDAETEQEENDEPETPAASRTATSSPTTAEPSKPAEPKPAPAASAKPNDPAPSKDPADRAIEKELAGKRFKYREWERAETEKFNRWIAGERQRIAGELQAERESFEKHRGEFTPRMEKAERVLKLMESADYEELAKEAGYEDWEKFQGHVMGTITDPNYKETRALRRELEERKAKEKADADAAEERSKQEAATKAQREHEQRRIAAITEHKQKLSARMAQSSDRLVRNMADDPAFIDTVFAIQRENYDRTEPDPEKATVSPEQAARMALRGGRTTVRDHLVQLRDRLNKALAEGDEPAAAEAAAAVAAATAKTEPAKPTASKTGVVPASATVEPAGPGKWKGGAKGKAWKDYAQQKMNEAADEEEQDKVRRARR